MSALLFFLPALSFAQSHLVPAVGAMRLGDHAQAIDHLRPHAGKGETQAQYLLGLALESAPGERRDLKSAREWYERAARAGHVGARYHLAALSGEPRDPREKAKLAQAAAVLGVAAAQAELGLAYRRGAGVPRNLALSHQWLLRAAENGHKGAMAELAWVYESGFGVRSNDERARFWREQAK
ncbi:MAG TPA: tetratricopeptide repeat protein [Burkholderiales bacterium]|nr:tetratricopeptide repeat protein [Burkholderiales bacterium]